MSRQLSGCVAALLLGIASACAADSRADFLKLLERPRAEAVVEISDVSSDGLAQYRFSFTSERGQRVPGILVKAAGSGGRRAVVIALHGTSGTKETMRPWLTDLAQKGFIAVAIDARYHGERTKAGSGSEEYQEAIVRAWREPGEHPFYYDSVWDVMRLVDYLAARDDVDPKRIGLVGISKGGIETYLAAAADPRIAVAVPCIGVQSFRWALEHNAWQSRVGTIQKAFSTIGKEAGVAKPDSDFVRKFYDRVVPGIYGEFDGPALLPLIAPRPLLVINGDSDDRTPLPGLNECLDAARTAYRKAGAEEHFAVRIQKKTGHEVRPASQQAAIDWFVRWLTPAEPAAEISRDAKYPAHWWTPMAKEGAPAWEIMPQEAGPGEVILSKRHELGLLSNFAATPFTYHGQRYASLEGFWQMMKYPENADDPRAKSPGVEWAYTREQVAALTSFDAKKAGSLADAQMKKMGITWVTFEGRQFEYRSATPGEHHRLIVEATREKVRQNPEVQKVLLATGDLILKPDHHQEASAPPEWRYFEILTEMRTALRAGSSPPTAP